ncbi:MAG: hypothetical protein EBU90_20115 [Proteobacteria bacterium]|nr:hypothetical protein [Pseudomonadota bacterium]NBP14630.1 hypothetical protein [bacterium]
MDQILWILNVGLPALVPEWFWHSLVVGGILGLIVAKFIRLIPFAFAYRLTIQIISSLALLLGVYQEGAGVYRKAAQEADAKLREAEEKIKKANAKLDAELAKGVGQIQSNTAKQVESIKTITKTINLSDAERKKLLELNASEKEKLSTLNAEERSKLEKQMLADKEKHLKEIDDLKKAVDSCPIPKIVVDEHNKAAKGGNK